MASAKSYTVNLFQPAMFGSRNCCRESIGWRLTEQTAVIRKGKVRGECPVKVETGEQKYDTTTVRFDNASGKPKIQEIRVGGTKTKLVFAM